MRNKDRHLTMIESTWYYVRRVPDDIAANDSRKKQVKKSLKTKNIHEARLKRDRLELADDARWSALRVGQGAESARERYDAAMALEAVTGLGTPSQPIEQTAFTHLIPRDMKVDGPVAEEMKPFLVKTPSQRHEAYAGMDEHTQYAARLAVLREEGVRDERFTELMAGVDEPDMTVSEALEVYLNSLIAGAWSTKSRNQLRISTNVKKRGVTNFIKAVSDKPILEITRKDALKFVEYHRNKMAKEGTGKNNANRDLSTMRTLYSAHVDYTQTGLETTNPFARLNFTEVAGEGKRRPSYEWPYVRDEILSKPNLLNRLKPDRRNALLVMVGTGARPSEIVNVLPENIHLDAPVPYIEIKPVADMQIKTAQSARKMPLVGFALQAMRDQGPEGFIAHRDKTANISGRINDWLRDNHLQPAGGESCYSFRHMFEDMGKDAATDHEMRISIFGHADRRPRYGRGFKLEDIAVVLRNMFGGFELPEGVFLDER